MENPTIFQICVTGNVDARCPVPISNNTTGPKTSSTKDSLRNILLRMFSVGGWYRKVQLRSDISEKSFGSSHLQKRSGLQRCLSSKDQGAVLTMPTYLQGLNTLEMQILQLVRHTHFTYKTNSELQTGTIAILWFAVNPICPLCDTYTRHILKGLAKWIAIADLSLGSLTVE